MKSALRHFANAVSGKSRERKWHQFLALMKPQPDETILDIGVNTTEYTDVDNYLEKRYPYPEKISVVGVSEDFTEFNKRYPAVRTFSSDGRNLCFESDSFDISYSNAVIEHVGPQPDQQRFLEEMLRVGKRGYLTTPNRLFPIETHTSIPLLHMVLTRRAFDAFLRLIGKGWATDYIFLLSERELRSLLRSAGIRNYQLVRNRFLGLPMTFTVTWHKQ